MEASHDPRCEVNRGGDHGPCSCGRDAEMRRERLANITTTAAVEDMIARYLQGETTDTLDTIRSLARQRDALRAIVAQNVVDCCVCKGTGKIESREDFGACPWCAPRRAALEVR